MNIRFLPEETISKISVGEFVNRPYLVIKELIENSLDAYSSEIKIEICNCGLDLIKVSDNGVGIIEKDLFLCVRRFSTSKIFYFNDLCKLNSFGFRGEALSAISSISEFIISSKIKSQYFGWKLFNNINDVFNFNIYPISHNIGTIVVVKNLFFNLCFLKKKICLMSLNEWLLIKSIINLFVLSNIGVGFTIYKDGKLYKKFGKLNNIKSNLLNRVLEIYGKNFFYDFFYIDLNNIFFLCKGYFFLNLGNKNLKLIFLNKRIISNTNLLFFVINKFIVDYFGRKLNFSYVLFFNINYQYININISPDKRKINFLNPSILIKNIYQDLLFFFRNNFSLNKFSFIKNNILLNKKRHDTKNSNILYKIDYFQYFLNIFGNIISFINNRFLFSFNNKYFILSDLFYIFYYKMFFIINKKFFFLIKKKKINLLKIEINVTLISDYIRNILCILGWEIIYKKKYIYVKVIPFEWINVDLKKFFLSFVNFLFKIKNHYFLFNKIIYWLSCYMIYIEKFNNCQSIILISMFHRICVNYKIYKKVFYLISLDSLLLFTIDDIWI